MFIVLPGGPIFKFLADHSTVTVLLGSGAALLSSRQEAERHRDFPAMMWEDLALLFLVGYLLATLIYKWWSSVPVVALALYFELWLARRCRSPNHSQSHKADPPTP